MYVSFVLASLSFFTFVTSRPEESLLPETTTLILGYDYVGCYTDTLNVRTFSSKTYVDDAMTNEKCANVCAGYTYFGTQYGRECFCGDVPHSGSARVQEAFCSFRCPGDVSQACGAGNHLTTYARSGTIAASPRTSLLHGFLGCYTEATTGRALTGPSFVNDQLTVEKCAATCEGFKYFGLEYQRECFCGDEPLGSGSIRVSHVECTYQCQGNKSQSCGGDLHLSLWEYGSISIPEASPETRYVRQGCYTEAYISTLGRGLRALTGKQYYDDAMTVEKCASKCSGFRYFGLEYGRECYCGQSVNSGSDVTDDSACNFSCSGDEAQTCGAGDHLDLYNFKQITTGSVTSLSLGANQPTISRPTVSSSIFESISLTGHSLIPNYTSTITLSPPSHPTSTPSSAQTLSIFALRVANTLQNNANGLRIKSKHPATGLILYINTTSSGWTDARFHVETNTNRLKAEDLYVSMSSNSVLYTVSQSQIGLANTYVVCASLVRQGEPIECAAENGGLTQFRTSTSSSSSNLALSIVAADNVGSTTPLDLIAELVE